MEEGESLNINQSINVPAPGGVDLKPEIPKFNYSSGAPAAAGSAGLGDVIPTAEYTAIDGGVQSSYNGAAAGEGLVGGETGLNTAAIGQFTPEIDLSGGGAQQTSSGPSAAPVGAGAGPAAAAASATEGAPELLDWLGDGRLVETPPVEG